jgi:hypothetical protein
LIQIDNIIAIVCRHETDSPDVELSSSKGSDRLGLASQIHAGERSQRQVKKADTQPIGFGLAGFQDPEFEHGEQPEHICQVAGYFCVDYALKYFAGRKKETRWVISY